MGSNERLKTIVFCVVLATFVVFSTSMMGLQIAKLSTKVSDLQTQAVVMQAEIERLCEIQRCPAEL